MAVGREAGERVEGSRRVMVVSIPKAGSAGLWDIQEQSWC